MTERKQLKDMIDKKLLEKKISTQNDVKRRIQLLDLANKCVAEDAVASWKSGLPAALMKSVEGLVSFGRSKARMQLDAKESMLFETCECLILAYDVDSAADDHGCSQGGSQLAAGKLSELSRMMLKVSSSAALGVLVERVCHPGDYDPEAQEQAMLLLARMFHGESARRQLTRKAFFQGDAQESCIHLLADLRAVLGRASTFGFQLSMLDTLANLGKSADSYRKGLVDPFSGYEPPSHREGQTSFMANAVKLLNKLNETDGTAITTVVARRLHVFGERQHEPGPKGQPNFVHFQPTSVCVSHDESTQKIPISYESLEGVSVRQLQSKSEAKYELTLRVDPAKIKGPNTVQLNVCLEDLAALRKRAFPLLKSKVEDSTAAEPKKKGSPPTASKPTQASSVTSPDSNPSGTSDIDATEKPPPGPAGARKKPAAGGKSLSSKSPTSGSQQRPAASGSDPFAFDEDEAPVVRESLKSPSGARSREPTEVSKPARAPKTASADAPRSEVTVARKPPKARNGATAPSTTSEVSSSAPPAPSAPLMRKPRQAKGSKGPSKAAAAKESAALARKRAAEAEQARSAAFDSAQRQAAERELATERQPAECSTSPVPDARGAERSSSYIEPGANMEVDDVASEEDAASTTPDAAEGRKKPGAAAARSKSASREEDAEPARETLAQRRADSAEADAGGAAEASDAVDDALGHEHGEGAGVEANEGNESFAAEGDELLEDTRDKAEGSAAEPFKDVAPAAKTAFNLYVEEKRQRLIRDGSLTLGEARKVLGEQWKKMDATEKRPWRQLETTLKERAATETMAMESDAEAEPLEDMHDDEFEVEQGLEDGPERFAREAHALRAKTSSVESVNALAREEVDALIDLRAGVRDAHLYAAAVEEQLATLEDEDISLSSKRLFASPWTETGPAATGRGAAAMYDDTTIDDILGGGGRSLDKSTTRRESSTLKPTTTRAATDSSRGKASRRNESAPPSTMQPAASTSAALPRRKRQIYEAEGSGEDDEAEDEDETKQLAQFGDVVETMYNTLQEWKERGRAQAWKAATSDLDGMDSRLESGFARLLEAGPRPSRAAVEAYKRLQERTQGVADEFHELKTTRTRLLGTIKKHLEALQDKRRALEEQAKSKRSAIVAASSKRMRDVVDGQERAAKRARKNAAKQLQETLVAALRRQQEVDEDDDEDGMVY